MSEALALHDRVHLGAQAKAQTTALLRAIGVVFRSAAAGKSVDETLQARTQDHEDLRSARALLSRLIRSPQEPATTGDPDWAGALVAPRTITAVLDVLSAQGNVLTQLPFIRFDLGDAPVHVPMRAAGSPDLAGAFRAEGDPIRVGRMTLLPSALSPKSMAVIATSSREMLRAAGDNVLDQAIRAGVMADTARVLDGIVFDDQPADAERPAGLGSLATGANTAVSSGTDAADISADLRARLDQLLANGYGSPSTRWVMNSLQAATLVQLFTETQMRDTFLRIPIVSGHMVPPDTVFLIDCAAVAFGADDPVFDTTTATALHEEDDPDAVAPIVDDAGAVAEPVRSLFQTHCAAIRMVWSIDWTLGGAGAVQTLTGVAW